VVSNAAKLKLLGKGGAAVSAKTFDQKMKLLHKQGKATLACAKPVDRVLHQSHPFIKIINSGGALAVMKEIIN